MDAVQQAVDLFVDASSFFDEINEMTNKEKMQESKDTAKKNMKAKAAMTKKPENTPVAKNSDNITNGNDALKEPKPVLTWKKKPSSVGSEWKKIGTHGNNNIRTDQFNSMLTQKDINARKNRYEAIELTEEDEMPEDAAMHTKSTENYWENARTELMRTIGIDQNKPSQDSIAQRKMTAVRQHPKFHGLGVAYKRKANVASKPKKVPKLMQTFPQCIQGGGPVARIRGGGPTGPTGGENRKGLGRGGGSPGRFDWAADVEEETPGATYNSKEIANRIRGSGPTGTNNTNTEDVDDDETMVGENLSTRFDPKVIVTRKAVHWRLEVKEELQKNKRGTGPINSLSATLVTILQRFPEEVAIYNNRSKQITGVWANATQFQKEFNVRRIPGNSTKNRATKYFIIFKVEAEVSLGEVRGHHGVSNILQYHKTRLFVSPWTDSDQQSRPQSLGVVLHRNPAFSTYEHSEIEVRKEMIEAGTPDKDIPVFKLVKSRASNTYINAAGVEDRVSARCFELQIQNYDYTRMKAILEKTYFQTKDRNLPKFLFYRHRYGKKTKEAYHNCLHFHAKAMSLQGRIMLQNIPTHVMRELGFDYALKDAFPTIIDIHETPFTEKKWPHSNHPQGQYNIVVLKENKEELRKQMRTSLPSVWKDFSDDKRITYSAMGMIAPPRLHSSFLDRDEDSDACESFMTSCSIATDYDRTEIVEETDSFWSPIDNFGYSSPHVLTGTHVTEPTTLDITTVPGEIRRNNSEISPPSDLTGNTDEVTKWKADVENKLKTEIESQLKSEIESQLKSEIETQLKNEIESQLESKFEGKYKAMEEAKDSRIDELQSQLADVQAMLRQLVCQRESSDSSSRSLAQSTSISTHSPVNPSAQLMTQPSSQQSAMELDLEEVRKRLCSESESSTSKRANTNQSPASKEKAIVSRSLAERAKAAVAKQKRHSSKHSGRPEGNDGHRNNE